MKRTFLLAYSLLFFNAVSLQASNETEPNDAFAQANAMLEGDVMTGNLGDAGGVDDYFVSVPSVDGTIRIAFSYSGGTATTDLIVTAYNKAQTSIGLRTISNLAATSDSLILYCRAADTIYIRINCTSAISYSFSYTVSGTGISDVEPNNSFAQATPFNLADTTEGTVGYANTASDEYDYHAVKLSSWGTLRVYMEFTNTSNSSQADFYLYPYDKNQLGLGQYQYINVAPGVMQTDTLYLQCIGPDTTYLRVRGTNGCFTYTFRYELANPVPAALTDVEPNNTTVTSKKIQPATTYNGTVGYQYYVPSPDYNDYYYIPLSGKTNLKFYLNISSNYDSPDALNADLSFSLVNKAGTQLFRKPYNNLIGPRSDTLFINCVSLDTVYVRFSGNACWPYSFYFTSEPSGPDADIEYVRTGNNVAFEAKTTGSNTFIWNFDNGQTSTSRFPTQQFGIGAYNVKLTVTDVLCSVPLVDSVFIEVAGVEDYFPKSAGLGGNVLLNVYGGGLDTTTKVSLVKGSTILKPISKITNSDRVVLTSDFDLHFADSGFYNVVIEIPGQPVVTFPNGFKIDDFSYPYCRAAVTGPTIWRRERNTNFQLNITNAGNVNANYVLVGFVYPKSVEVTFLPKKIRLRSGENSTVELDGESYTLPNDSILQFADSSAIPFPIDSLRGQPYDGYLLYMVIPKVPHNATVSMPFIARSEDGGNRQFFTFTHHPNMFGSCITYHWSNTTNSLMGEAIDLMDMASGDNLPAQAFTKSLKIGQKHLQHSGALMGAHFDAWWNGYEVTPEMYSILNGELDQANAFAMQATYDEVTGLLLDYGVKGVLKNNKEKNEWWNKTVANNADASPELFDDMMEQLVAQGADATRFERLSEMLSAAKNLKTLEEKRQVLLALIVDCPELQPQLDELLALLDDEWIRQDPLAVNTFVTFSRDPNAIYGPEGILSPRYLRTNDPSHYMITCENVDTATAPAQIVVITDTLNKAHYNLSTFTFNGVTIGEKSMRLLGDRHEVFGELSLYPEIPLMARVSAKLDTATGVVRWVMVGLDTLTDDLPTNALLGLLPPNDFPPLGEASVSYSVRLKDNLANGTVVNNTASIVFDENEPIITNTWSNTIDIEQPVSTIAGHVLENDTVIKLVVERSDALSGVNKYKVFVSKNGGEWQSIGSSMGDTVTLTGEPGNTYGFYVVAKDNVGNIEGKTPQVEEEVEVPLVSLNAENILGLASIYPNPTSGEVHMILDRDMKNAVLSFYDATGRLILKKQLSLIKGDNYLFDMKQLDNGLYNLQITSEGMTGSQRVVLQK